MIGAAGVLAALVACAEAPVPEEGVTTPEAPAATPGPGADEASASPPPPLDEELQAIAVLVGRREGAAARERLADRLERTPDDARAIFLLGLSHHREGAYVQAEPHFVRALELAPGYDLVHHFLGWCRFHQGDLDGARASFARHVAADPDEVDSWFGLGLAALEAGDLDDAERDLRRALDGLDGLRERDPRRFQARVGDVGKYLARLGEVSFARGEYAEARARLEAAVERDPRQYTAWFVLSQACRRLGDEAAADAALAQSERMREAVRGDEPMPPMGGG